MPFLVRSIIRSKWGQPDVKNTDDAGADAITRCLKTTGNTLSVWRIESTEDLDVAVLAFVSTNERLDKLDFVLLDEQQVIEAGIKIDAEVLGDSPVVSLNETHRNLADLGYAALGRIKDLIIEVLRKDGEVRYRPPQLSKILKEAIQNGLVKSDDLKEKVREQLDAA